MILRLKNQNHIPEVQQIKVMMTRDLADGRRVSWAKKKTET